MPVLITAADQPLAYQIAVHLLREGAEVRTVTDGDASQLRTAGVFVARGALDDEGLIEAAAEGAHTLVHVGRGALTASTERIVAESASVLRAAEQAGIQRVIGLSLPGATDDAADVVRRAKAAVEEMCRRSPIPSVVIRASLIDLPAIRDALVTSGLGGRARDAMVAPVDVKDLADLVVAFDRARSEAKEGHLLVVADGPRQVTVADWVDHLRVEQGASGSLVGRRLLDPRVAAQLDEILHGPWISNESSALDGWSFAGIQPRDPLGSAAD